MGKRSSSDHNVGSKRMKVDNIIDNNSLPSRQASDPSIRDNPLPSPSLTHDNIKVQYTADVDILSPEELWLRCGNLALSLNNNYNISISCFQSALGYNPESKFALNGLVVYLSINEIEKCHTVLTTALGFSKNNPSLWLALGKCFNKMNMPRDAVNALTNALYLLPKELIDVNEIDVARSVHLELAIIILNDGDVESAKAELGIISSLPKPDDEKVLQACFELSEKLIIHFFKYGNLLNAIWVCEAFERINEKNSQISLFHAYFLLNSDAPSYDILRARRLLINSIRSDPSYKQSQNLMAFIKSNQGDFLPWLLLTECYFFLNFTTTMLDCFTVSLTKCTSRADLSVIREQCRKIQSICKDNEKAKTGIANILNMLGENDPTEKSNTFNDLLLMSYQERMNRSNQNIPIVKTDVSQVNNIPSRDIHNPQQQQNSNNSQLIQYPPNLPNIQPLHQNQPSIQTQQSGQPMMFPTHPHQQSGMPIGYNYPMQIPPQGISIQHTFAPPPPTNLQASPNSNIESNKPPSRSSNTPKSDFEEESRFRQHQEKMRNRQEEELRYYYQRQSLPPHPGMMLPPMPGYPPGIYQQQMNGPSGSIPTPLAIQQAQQQAQAQAHAQAQHQLQQYQSAHSMAQMDPSMTPNRGYSYF